MDRAELAAEAGVDAKTVYNLERRGKWPIAVTRAKIEAALRWAPGEMETIASAPEPLRPKPPTPEQVEHVRKGLRELFGEGSLLERAMDEELAGLPRPTGRDAGDGEARSARGGGRSPRHRRDGPRSS